MQSCSQYDIKYDIKYDIISYELELIRKYLTVLPPEAVAFQIEGIASCLGPFAVALTLPLNAAKCTQLSFAAEPKVLTPRHALIRKELQKHLWYDIIYHI